MKHISLTRWAYRSLCRSSLSAVVALAAGTLAVTAAALTEPAGTTARVLPGELSAEQILDGGYPFPPSPESKVTEDWSGFARERLTKVPAPGVHPRVLLSPEDLPGLRRRLQETETGRKLVSTLHGRLGETILCRGTWENELFEKLAAGDPAGAQAILNRKLKASSPAAHYQPTILYGLVMAAFDAMVKGDAADGGKVATAIASYAKLIEPALETCLQAPLADDVWRIKVQGPVTGTWTSDQGLRGLMGNHLLGYAYDFAYNFMTEPQRTQVRRVIARATAGRIWMGAQLPHHFRNWNWVAIGLSQPLLALAIEGEPGYDPRVYKLGVAIARDYLTYGISERGGSTEAVGYTQFGLVWGNPFFVAASRRGESLLAQSHHRAMIDWYLQTMQPFAPRLTQSLPGTDAEQQQRSLPATWLSHGDGGDEGPAVWTMAMWKYFYPKDPKIDFLWQNVIKAGGKDMLKERIHIIEPLIFASDCLKDSKGRPVDYASGGKLGLPLTWFDPERGSLISRNEWTPDALVMQFECRTDSVGGSHEHADRGAFTLSALGRCWAKDNFRSVETKYHNSILIDGLGQGFWPGPGKWLGLVEEGNLLIASCDAADCYNWWWPKEILTEPESAPRFQYSRWQSFREDAQAFRHAYGDLPSERDTRLSVVAFWKGFEAGDPRLWDEDTWPVRLPHNPVRRAFRTLAMARGPKPFVLVVDDMQKDDGEHLYEWLMQTGPNTEVVSLKDNDVVLGDATASRDANGVMKPARGERQLLVRILEMNEPAKARDYTSRPAIRLETFERKDTLVPEARTGALSGSRSFGLDKRLVIASRSVAPDFKVLLFPHRNGEPLPVTAWNRERTRLTVECQGQTTVFSLAKDADGRTQVTCVK